MALRYKLRQGKLRPHPKGEWVPYWVLEALAAQMCSCGRVHETDPAKHAVDCNYRIEVAAEGE